MRKMIKIIVILFIIYVISLLVLFLIQEKIIFQGIKLDPNFKYSFKENFEEINLKTNDGNLINALHFKVENPKGIILYFHGNRGNLDRWGNITRYFNPFEYDVFVMDYRSYGKSTGKPNEALMYQDAQWCYDYVKKIFSEEKITVFGRSLGCTFAVKVASQNKPKQLILQSPFYNMTDAAKYHYPFVPFKFLLKYKFNSNLFIEKVTCKTTIFHGTKDKVIPFTSGEKLFRKATNNVTQFVTIKNGTHHNLTDFELFDKTIFELLIKE